MSAPSPSRSATSTAAASTMDSQPAPVTDIRDGPRHSHGRAEPRTAAAAGSAGQSDSPAALPPAVILHRHALESVFAFLGLRELTFALRVSRDWLAAVGSMRRLDLAVIPPSADLDVVAWSAMGRHVGAIGGPGNQVWLSVGELSVVAERMARLHSLRCTLRLPLPGRHALFPAQLRQLDIILFGSADAADINAAIASIGRLPVLEDFDMSLPVVDPQFSFAPLAAQPLLRRLDVSWHRGGELSDAQIDELRALPRLRKLNVKMSLPLLRRLLRQPHDLQWQQVSLPFPLDDEVAAVVPQLPSLTAVVHRRVECERYDWLTQLPNLRTVDLRFFWLYGAEGRAESLVAGLRYCAKVEILELGDCSDVTAAQLADLLPRLPRLRELTLDNLRIDSLAFLAQPPLTNQLSRLKLIRCRRLPTDELRHVHGLRGLRALELERSFTAPLDSASQSQLMPPSLLLPRLEQFRYEY